MVSEGSRFSLRPKPIQRLLTSSPTMASGELRHPPWNPIGANLTRRSAPVLGRSIARPLTARDNPRFLYAIQLCCARGRAHSVSVLSL